MEQFKNLNSETGYKLAWQYLMGYFEDAFKQFGCLKRPELRKLLDRMQSFADVQPVLSPLSVQLDLSQAPADEDSYRFCWLLLLGYFEAAYHFSRRHVRPGDLLHVLDQMCPLAGPVPYSALQHLRTTTPQL